MKQSITHTLAITALCLILVLTGAFGVAVYKGYHYTKESDARIADLERRLLEQSQLSASTTAALSDSIKIIEGNLDLTKTESAAIAERLAQTLYRQQQTVASIGGTLGTLEKLSQTDPELLIKYSKVSFLNENYVPKKLSEIKNQYLYNEDKTQYFLTDALPFLISMFDAATKDGVTIYTKSAYRSFNEQDKLKSAYTVTYGSGANTFSADQGYSEHQLGTTVDLITTGQGGQLAGFDKTQAHAWLQNNAYKYGFILSYPKGNAYYIYEPWHWRFVGTKLATYLHDNNMNFYDMDQRKIDEYLVSLFD